MKWFSLETSSPRVSMAIGNNLVCLQEVSAEGNASVLIEPLFRKLNVNWEEIQKCIIGQGPGSYNGLRVGYAFLKGLLCLNPLPVIEIATPLILATHASEHLSLKNADIFVLNNARRKEMYGALVEIQNGLPRLQWQTIIQEKSMVEKLPAKLDAIVSYDYAPDDLLAFGAYPQLFLFPSATFAGQIAFKLNLPAKAHLSELEPHYVRPPVPSN